MNKPPTSEALENYQPRLLLDLLLSAVIPAIIISNLSGEDGLGARNALLLALAFPFGWGMIELLKYEKLNLISLLGLIGVLLTGGIALLQLEVVWLAISNAAMPGVMGIAILTSALTPRYSVISQLLNNYEIFGYRQIKEKLAECTVKKEAADALLLYATYLFAGICFFAAAMNYLLTRWIVVSSAGSAAFNEELARLSLLSYGAIMFPTLIMAVVLFLWLRRALVSLAGIAEEADESMVSVEVRPTSIGFSLMGTAILLPLAVAVGWWADNPWWQVLHVPASVYDWGVIVAAAAVGAAMGWLHWRFQEMHAVRAFDFDWVLKPLAAIEPSHRNIALQSLFTGVFGELLFRAALQPVVGLVPAALLFALMHAQIALFAPSRTQAVAYFAIIVAIGLLLGWVFDTFGLWAAIALHGVYEYVLWRLLAPRIVTEHARLVANFKQGPGSS